MICSFDDAYHPTMSVQVEGNGAEFSVLFKRESPDGEEKSNVSVKVLDLFQTHWDWHQ